jgi:hypothetical protein
MDQWVQVTIQSVVTTSGSILHACFFEPNFDAIVVSTGAALTSPPSSNQSPLVSICWTSMLNAANYGFEATMAMTCARASGVSLLGKSTLQLACASECEPLGQAPLQLASEHRFLSQAHVTRPHNMYFSYCNVELSDMLAFSLQELINKQYCFALGPRGPHAASGVQDSQSARLVQPQVRMLAEEEHHLSQQSLSWS